MRISDWSSDVCSSDLACRLGMDERRRHFLVVGACPPATPILLASQSALPGRTRRHAPETRATEKPAPRSIDSVGAGAGLRPRLLDSADDLQPNTVDRKSTRLNSSH